jgi:SH3-like domain-containing protein
MNALHSFTEPERLMRRKGHYFSLLLLLICIGLMTAAPVFAEESPKLPRFASLKNDEIFVRTGPALQYPIRWVYKKRGLPVEIVKEYDTWRQIRDFDGGVGWVHQAMLSPYRSAIIIAKDGITALVKPEQNAGSVVKLDRGVVAAIDECEPAWCEVRISGFRGWVPRAELWGIYPGEEIH